MLHQIWTLPSLISVIFSADDYCRSNHRNCMVGFIGPFSEGGPMWARIPALHRSKALFMPLVFFHQQKWLRSSVRVPRKISGNFRLIKAGRAVGSLRLASQTCSVWLVNEDMVNLSYRGKYVQIRNSTETWCYGKIMWTISRFNIFQLVKMQSLV